MKWGWWPEELADHFQEFHKDLVAGKRPKIAVEAPPHGKSCTVTDFIAWLAGKNPNLKTIFASFSDELGQRTNIDLQRIMRSHATPRRSVARASAYPARYATVR